MPFIEEVFNEGNLATIDELIDPDGVDQVDPVSTEEARSLEGAAIRRGVPLRLPDMYIIVEAQIAEGTR